MNDLTHGAAIAAATIIPGAVWRAIEKGPWRSDKPLTAKIIDARDGWVRYYINPFWSDERAAEADFRKLYESTDLYAAGDLLKAPVPRDEVEAAVGDLLSAFYYHAGETNFAVRDAAIRRAQLAIGAKVTL